MTANDLKTFHLRGILKWYTNEYILIKIHQANPYDPGKCTEKKRGNFVVVKDRNDDDQIVVCVQRHGRYRWDMINGIHVNNTNLATQYRE